MKVLEVNRLRKKLDNREVIKNVTFSVEEGEIFGFLGSNGAGKTTTIRMLVGLINYDSGSIKICGQELKKDKIKALSKIGAIVENPELYKSLTGRQNLMQIARIRGNSKKEIEEIIQLVGLTDRVDDRVRKYSLGMKQRLGLAIALLSNPKLLILDEPTNGLDPTGILDLRAVIHKAAKERGMAVFVSSHILSEVQQLCTKVAFISDGTIKSVEEVNKSNNTIKTDKEVVLVVSNDESKKLITKIDSLSFVHKTEVKESGIEVTIDSGKTSSLLKELINDNFNIEDIHKVRVGLEQRYMELVEGGIR